MPTPTPLTVALPLTSMLLFDHPLTIAAVKGFNHAVCCAEGSACRVVLLWPGL
jgi:hypothetical protein